MVTLALVLVSASSVVFGLGHSDYGLWKILPTVVAGLGMGYLFVRRGLLAAILFHFATDLMVSLIYLTDAGGELASETGQILLGLLILVFLFLGVFFFVWYLLYAKELWRHLVVSWGFRTPAPAAAPAPPFPAWNAPAPPMPGPSAQPPMAPPGVPPPPFAPASGLPAFGPAWIRYACPRCGWQEARYDANGFTCLRCGHASR